MSRTILAWISGIVLVGVVGIGVGDALSPDPVPLAPPIDLSGDAPPVRPTLDGFFVVPPRVIDVREDDGDAADDRPDSVPPARDDSQDDSAEVDDFDGSPDDSPDLDDSPDDSPDDDD